ncbi:MAG: hypothetical protein ACE5KM_09700 [Planctomycetaceae bacterium]
MSNPFGEIVMPGETKIRVGTAAVPFQLEDAEGNSHRLEDYTGRWLLLVFHRHLA